MSWTGRLVRAFHGNEKGISLTETLVALAVLGALVVAFSSGLATALRGSSMADRRGTAVSLARSQMEWVKGATYVSGATGYAAAPLPASEEYLNYTAEIVAQPFNNPDDGIQRITVTVRRSGEELFTLTGYKVNR